MSVLIYIEASAALPPASLNAEELCLPPADLIDVEEAEYAG